MELKVGMELELIKDLDCGIRVIDKGEVFRVQHISANKVSLINNEIGVGVFELEEVKEYFKEHIEEIKTDEDIKLYKTLDTLMKEFDSTQKSEDKKMLYRTLTELHKYTSDLLKEFDNYIESNKFKSGK